MESIFAESSLCNTDKETISTLPFFVNFGREVKLNECENRNICTDAEHSRSLWNFRRSLRMLKRSWIRHLQRANITVIFDDETYNSSLTLHIILPQN